MQIPGYEILEKLGEGGTATVWKARQVALDRTVALKILNHAMAADPEAAERFRTEGLAAAKLAHQNIVQVFDAGEVEGQPYFAMEFVEGESIGDRLQRKGRIPPEQALAVAESVATALKYAWDKAQIIHCDVKPDNILLDSDGTIKVADLGLARILSHREGHAERDVIGTPNYVSPEQAEGGQELDFRSDIYSLGATLYHLVTGVMPFNDLKGAEAMDGHVKEFLNDPVELNPGVPPAAAWLIEKMMVRNRNDRYSSWNEVADDLDAVINGRLPLPPLPTEGQSTVTRSSARVAVTEAATGEVKKSMKAKAVNVGSSPSNVKVDKEAMRAKFEAMNAKQAPEPKSPQKMILPITIAAVVIVGAFWILMQRGADGLSNLDRILGRKPVLKDEAHEINTSGGPGPQGSAAVPGGNVAWIPPKRTSNELRVIHNSALYGDYTNALYVRGAAQYNNALRAFVEYTEGKMPANNLKRIEVNLKNAIEAFEKCKEDAPDKYDVPGYILKCSNLMSEVRTAMQSPK